jgi:hypothetical protein
VPTDLTTTNVLLGIMAAVSVLEGIAVIALLFGGVLAYRRFERLIRGIEERHLAPAAGRVNAILDDVKGVTGVARQAAESTDSGVRWGVAWLMRHIGPKDNAE